MCREWTARSSLGSAVNSIPRPMINEAMFALQEASRPPVDAGTKLGRNPLFGPLCDREALSVSQVGVGCHRSFFQREFSMKRLSVFVVLGLFAAGPAFAQSCNAVSADGKPLGGAAKASFMKKCCEDNAKSADGKALAGAAKKSSVDKCMKG